MAHRDRVEPAATHLVERSDELERSTTRENCPPGPCATPRSAIVASAVDHCALLDNLGFTKGWAKPVKAPETRGEAPDFFGEPPSDED